MKEEKSELEGRKYWKEKAERLQRENIELKNRLDAYELALNIWSRGQSELLMGKNYESQFENIAIMQEENDKLKIHIEAKDKAYMDLLADYNYLKARIKKTERAFIKYKEKLEKLEVDLDMVVMNR